MAYNKIIYGNQILIDMTDATITGSSEADKILNGYTAYAADGTKVTGTSTYDVDSSNTTATQSEVLATKTFASHGSVLTGTMPNIGEQDSFITTVAQSVAIAQGYHDGSGTVEIDSTEQAKVIASNIRDGVSILGVTGSYSGTAVPTQTKSATPYTTAQTILPDAGYNLSQVDISAIYYNESANAYGTTVTIGTVAP